MTSPVYAIEAPADRIWAYTNARGSRVWTAMMPAIAGAHEEQEYVRADLHEEAARQAEALQRENAELRKKLDACDCYWPEDDTSSDACADGPWQIAENFDLPPGEVLAYSRGGVVETRYYAYLPPADDADSDDQFEVDAETELAVKQAIEAETARRARALLGGENAE